MKKINGNEQKIISILKAFSKTFVCLRCGECCTNWEVRGVPGYNKNRQWTGNLEDRGIKPEQSVCRHLEPAKIVGDVWEIATCKLHRKSIYPEECKLFCWGNSYCPLGISIWSIRKDKAKILEHISRILKNE